MRASARKLLGPAGLIAAFCAWQVISMLGLVPPTSLPSASDTLRRLVTLLGAPQTWVQLGRTVAQTGAGFLICAAVAIPVGIVIGRIPVVEAFIRSTVNFLRSVPGIALVPLFVLFMGPEPSMVVILTVCVSIWPLLISVVEGARAIDPTPLDMARSFRLGKLRTLGTVVVPAASPFIMSGLRITATVCLLVVVGSQLIASAPGIGQQMALANANGDARAVYALSVLAGILGVTINLALRAAEKRIMRWHHAATAHGRTA